MSSDSPGNAEPQMKLTFTGNINATNIVVTPPLTLQDVAENFAAAIEITVTQQLGSSQKLLGVVVTKIGDTVITNRRNIRKLLETRSLADVLTKIEFEIRLSTMCGTSNCQDGETLTNELYEEVTNSIDEAIQKGDETIEGSFQSTFLSVTTDKGQSGLISVDSYQAGTYGR